MLIASIATGLPPRVLPVIQAIEGGSAGTIRQDSNGTADLGVMQINTIWVPALAARAQLSEAETRQRLIDDPCFNIAASALILRFYRSEENGSLMTAIGDYHSHTQALNVAYAALAESKAGQLFEGKKP